MRAPALTVFVPESGDAFTHRHRLATYDPADEMSPDRHEKPPRQRCERIVEDAGPADRQSARSAPGFQPADVHGHPTALLRGGRASG